MKKWVKAEEENGSVAKEKIIAFDVLFAADCRTMSAAPFFPVLDFFRFPLLTRGSPWKKNGALRHDAGERP